MRNTPVTVESRLSCRLPYFEKGRFLYYSLLTTTSSPKRAYLFVAIRWVGISPVSLSQGGGYILSHTKGRRGSTGRKVLSLVIKRTPSTMPTTLHSIKSTQRFSLDGHKSLSFTFSFSLRIALMIRHLDVDTGLGFEMKAACKF